MGTRIFASQDGGACFEAQPAQLPELMADESARVWVSLDQQGPQHLRILTDVMQLHPLLVEDALDVAPTPKAEDHGDYTYLILHGLRHRAFEGKDEKDVPGAAGKVETVDVDFFIGERFLITHHRLPMPSLEAVRGAVMKDDELLAKGPAYVAHALIDHMIDAYQPMMERLDREVVRVERAALEDPDPKLLESIFAPKHALQGLRRVGIHQREILRGLATRRFRRIPEGIEPFCNFQRQILAGFGDRSTDVFPHAPG